MHAMEAVTGAILVSLTVALFWAWRAIAERPGRWDRYLTESFWLRGMR